MFAIVAAVLFVLGVLVPDNVTSKDTMFWLLIGLAAWALHHSGVWVYNFRHNRSANG